MAFNDNKVYYFIKVDERFTEDLNIILLKTTPGGMEVIYTYLELMILAGKTGGMLIDSGTFSSFPKQLSYELKGITPEQIGSELLHLKGLYPCSRPEICVPTSASPDS